MLSAAVRLSLHPLPPDQIDKGQHQTDSEQQQSIGKASSDDSVGLLEFFVPVGQDGDIIPPVLFGMENIVYRLEEIQQASEDVGEQVALLGMFIGQRAVAVYAFSEKHHQGIRRAVHHAAQNPRYRGKNLQQQGSV